MRFTKSKWTDSAAESLATALGDDVEIIADQVRENLAQLWIAPNGSHIVVRRESNAFVVVAFEGSQMREVTPALIECAKASGCDHIRFHTTRPALIRLLRKFHPEPLEYVLRIPLGSTH